MIDLAIYTTASAIFVAIIWDIFKTYFMNSNNKNLVKKAIRGEIKNNNLGLKEFKIGVEKIDGKRRVNMILISKGAYDSCINSGHFILLDVELQAQISNYYSGIVGFNFTMQSLNELLNNPDYPEILQFVEKRLNLISEMNIPELIKISTTILENID